MEIRVLGPVEVVGPTGTVTLRGRLAALLAVLVARRGRVISIDTLVEYVFDGDAPPGATSTLHGYVHRLRRRIPDLVCSAPGGYRLNPESVIDADLFACERLEALAASRAGDSDRCRVLFESALGRWRGRAYDCFSDREYAEAEAFGLEELRRQTEDDYLTQLCSTASGGPLIADLEAAVRAEPSRERRWALLIGALQRAGRPSDAVEAADRFRTWLRDEFDVAPTPDFEAFEATICGRSPGEDQSKAADARPDLGAGARAALEAVPAIPLGVAAEVALDAAHRLITHGVFAEAEELFGQAVSLVEESDPRRAARALLGRAEARARMFGSNWTESLDAAVDLSRRFHFDDLLVQAALLNPRGIVTGEPSRVELLRSLLAELPATSPDRPALLAQHALELLEPADDALRTTEMAEAVAATTPARTDRGRIRVLVSVLNDIHRFITPEERCAIAAELDEVAGNAGDGQASWVASAHLYWAAVQQARGTDAAAWLQIVMTRARSSSAIVESEFAEHMLAVDAFVAGNLDKADEHLALSLPGGPKDDGVFGIDRANRDSVLLRLRREQGRLDEVLPLVTGDLPPYPALLATSARALIAAELGDITGACTALESCPIDGPAPAFVQPHLTSIRLEAAALIGDVERASREADRLRPHAGQVLCFTHGCDGAVDRYLGLAAAVAGDRRECNRWLGSAVKLHESLGSPTYLTRTLYDRARLLGDATARDRGLVLARSQGLTALATLLEQPGA